MRSLWLTVSISALLAGCAGGESGQTPAVTAGEGQAAHVHGAPGDTAIRPHMHLTSIPAAFHGVYDRSLEACARPSDQRLTVSARELRFHESVGSVRSIGYGGSDAIAVEADYEGEGRRWRNLRILKLAENGARLSVKGDGDSLDRVRCPAGAR
ncbi:MAG TPA: hypothetical protein VE891_10500 [Allosphingosinicella sp.]|nr:hypothetical protein [Allosphingosinicella sp.]